MTDDEPLLLEAIALAGEARAAGNHPFGALLADPAGRIVLRAQNTVITERDVTGHAETNLVRRAGARFTVEELGALTLFTSTEPCAMCAGAIFWSGLGAVVYALAEADLYSMTGDDPGNLTLRLPCREVFARGRRPIDVRGPYDLTPARDVHAGFWSP